MMTQKPPIKKDDWGIVLDYLTQGHVGMARSQPVGQLVGDKYFSLLEVIVREGATLTVGERVYIGDEKRDKVKYIAGRLKETELSGGAKNQLPQAVELIIEKNPKQFVDFFNNSGSITTRQHQLELLPGIGKKHLWAILDERKVKPFESFEDIKNRVALIPDPKKMVVKRVLEEIEEKDRYSLFVLRPKEGEKEKVERQQVRF